MHGLDHVTMTEPMYDSRSLGACRDRGSHGGRLGDPEAVIRLADLVGPYAGLLRCLRARLHSAGAGLAKALGRGRLRRVVVPWRPG